MQKGYILDWSDPPFFSGFPPFCDFSAVVFCANLKNVLKNEFDKHPRCNGAFFITQFSKIRIHNITHFSINN